MRRISRILLVLTVLVASLFAFLLWRGPEPGGIDDLYTRAFGPADLGDVDFERLERRASPNDALACPPDFCAAEADIASPVFDVPGARLREIVAEVAQAEPGTDLVYSARWDEADRFLVRTRLMRFPDTVSARVVGAGPGRSSVALYSRSQIGHSDMGANRARIERWLAAIAARVAAEPARPQP